jgi:hypothetical protein
MVISSMIVNKVSDLRDVPIDHRAQVPCGIVEQRPDLGEAEPEPAQRLDPVHPADVLLVVHAVAAAGLSGWLQQAGLVVIAQRAHGDPAQLGELPHSPLRGAVVVADGSWFLLHVFDPRT